MSKDIIKGLENIKVNIVSNNNNWIVKIMILYISLILIVHY